jgi:hypothetical protein
MNSIPHLLVEGERLTSITLNTNVVLYFGAEQEFKLRIMEEDFELLLAGSAEITNVHFAAWATPPKDTVGITSLSTLINSKVTFAEISEVGVLRILFEGDSSLLVRPGGTYEAYTIVGAGEVIVCNGNGLIA